MSPRLDPQGHFCIRKTQTKSPARLCPAFISGSGVDVRPSLSQLDLEMGPEGGGGERGTAHNCVSLEVRLFLEV